MPRIIQITDWRSTQHYKQRNPPWVKLHNELLDRSDLAAMQNSDWGVYAKLLLLASRFRNRIVLDERVLLRRWGITRKAIDNCVRFGLVRIIDRDAIDEVETEQIESESASAVHQTPDAMNGQHSPDDRLSARQRSNGAADQEVSPNSASTALAPCSQDARPEERESQRERRGDTDSEGESEAARTQHRDTSQRADGNGAGRNPLREIAKDAPPPMKSPPLGVARKNGDYERINDAVQQLIAQKICTRDDYDGIAKIAGISEKQARTSVQQLIDRGRIR